MLLNSLSKYVLCLFFLSVYLIKLGAQLTFDALFMLRDSFCKFYRDTTGKFPEYPDDDDGGSAAIFKQKDPAELENELAGKVTTHSFRPH